MSIEAETSNLAVDKSLELTEAAVKLAAMGAKNLAALIFALATDSDKLTGKSNLQTMVKEGKEPVVFPLNKRDVQAFSKQAKGQFQFTTIKAKDSNTVQVIACRDDIDKINEALSNIGYGAQSLKRTEQEKNGNPRAQSSRVSTERGNGLGLQAKTSEPERTHPDLLPTGAKQVIYHVAQNGEKGLEALGADTLAVVAAALLGDELNWIEKTQLKRSIADLNTNNRQPTSFHVNKYDMEAFRKQLRKGDIAFIAIPSFSGNAIQIVADVKDMSAIHKVMNGLGYSEPPPVVQEHKKRDGKGQDKPSIVDTIESVKREQRERKEGKTKQKAKEAQEHTM